jgi:hypothetical protein
MKAKLQSRDHSSTNSKHVCAEGSVTTLKMCYGESADNFFNSLHIMSEGTLRQWCRIFRDGQTNVHDEE